MSELLITSYAGRYQLVQYFATEPIGTYDFLGADLGAQLQNARALAQAMRNGMQALQDQVYSLLDVDKENFPDALSFIESTWNVEELALEGEVLLQVDTTLLDAIGTDALEVLVTALAAV